MTFCMPKNSDLLRSKRIFSADVIKLVLDFVVIATIRNPLPFTHKRLSSTMPSISAVQREVQQAQEDYSNPSEHAVERAVPPFVNVDVDRVQVIRARSRLQHRAHSFAKSRMAQTHARFDVR